MRHATLVLCLLAAVLQAGPLSAQTETQLQFLGAKTPIASSVDGFRASVFYGELESMRGFDLGIFSLSKSGRFSGFGLVFGAAWITEGASGAVVSFLNVNEGDTDGALLGFVNTTGSARQGANVGFVNITEGYSNLDISGVGYARQANVQIGFVNVTERIDSVQIGLLNAAENGFAPIFPLFNYPRD